MAANRPTFTRESDLLAPVEGWLRASGYQVKVEYSLPWGIADLVACKFNPTSVLRRLERRQGAEVGPLPRLEVLLSIPDTASGQEISLDALQESLSHQFPRATLEHHLEHLVKRNFVRRSDRNSFQKKYSWSPLHSEILTVELKLHRAADVINQAALNTELASRSYVAMPHKQAERLLGRQGSELTSFGIGVLSVGRHSVKELLSPCFSPTHADPVLQAHAAERFWRTIKDKTSLAAEQLSLAGVLCPQP